MTETPTPVDRFDLLTPEVVCAVLEAIEEYDGTTETMALAAVDAVASWLMASHEDGRVFWDRYAWASRYASHLLRKGEKQREETE